MLSIPHGVIPRGTQGRLRLVVFLRALIQQVLACWTHEAESRDAISYTPRLTLQIRNLFPLLVAFCIHFWKPSCRTKTVQTRNHEGAENRDIVSAFDLSPPNGE